jgi:sulfofructose kinase
MMNPPQVDLVGVGLNATDTLIAVPSFPPRGCKMEYQDARVLPGGQVATAVVACQIWGLTTRYVGIVGDDSAGAIHGEAFARAGVETQISRVSGGTSPQSLILVDGGGERTVLYRRDPRVALKPADLDRQWILNSRSLLVDGYDTEAATEAAIWARAAGIPVIADLDDVYPGVEKLLPNVDYLIVSRDIPCKLMEETDLELALQQMQRHYGCRLTAATLGENGVLAWDGKTMFHRCAFAIPAVDTTGAGDIFHAGFIYGLHQDWTLEYQLDFACAAAALNCTASGARGCIAPVEQIRSLIAECERYKSADFPCTATTK